MRAESLSPWYDIRSFSQGRVEKAPAFAQASVYGSILPAVWSFMLAGRARGLGMAWTPLHLVHEKEAAELLGVPETHTQVALLCLSARVVLMFSMRPLLTATALATACTRRGRPRRKI